MKKEQKERIKDFINSLPYFDKERRIAPCLYCDRVTEDGIHITRIYSDGVGYDAIERKKSTFIGFENIKAIINLVENENGRI